MKPWLLDVFCCAGGTTRGYQRAGFCVVGIDKDPQPNYIGEHFIQMDALEALNTLATDGVLPCDGGWFELGDFAAAHASPPCQAHSPLKAVTRHIQHVDLIAPTRALLERTGLPYVIENVPKAPLRDPIMLCGSSFGLDVRRHRLFESNFPLMSLPCQHGQQRKEFDRFQHGRWFKSPVVAVYGSGGGKAREHWDEAMQIDWMTTAELAQAIPPAFTEFIGTQLREFLRAEVAA